MEISFTEVNGRLIAQLSSEEIVIKNAQDAVDIMMNCQYQGADSIIIEQEHLIPDFFDLKTGVAGEILQKFSTYNSRLAIIGNFENIASKSLKDFLFESNKIGRINFVSSLNQAIAVLAK